jgi:DNA-binding MarR family transcriptional regulator
MTIQELQKAIQPLMKYELFTVRQLAFLLNLEQIGGNTEAGLIRKSLGIGRPATSRAIDSLGQKHLITRMRSEADRRFRNVKITDEGSALVQQLCDGAGLWGGDLGRRRGSSMSISIPSSGEKYTIPGARRLTAGRRLAIIKFYDHDPKRATEQVIADHGASEDEIRLWKAAHGAEGIDGLRARALTKFARNRAKAKAYVSAMSRSLEIEAT